MFSNCDSKILDSFVGGVRLWKILCLSVNLCLAYQNNLLQAGRQAGKQASRHLPPPPASRSRSATVTFLAWWNCMYTDRTLLPQKKKLLFWDTFRSYEQWWWTCLCVFVCCVCCVRKFLVCRSLSFSLSFFLSWWYAAAQHKFFFFFFSFSTYI